MSAPTLSTGLSLLNLGISGKTNVALRPGDYLYIVGDSGTGKSWLIGQLLAEAANNPEYDKYDLIDDDIENGMSMDIAKFFGPKLAKRIRPPAGTRAKPEYSSTTQELYDHIDDAHERWKQTGRPFIYCVDSMDGLTTEEDEQKFQDQKKARRRGTVTTGTMGMAKAKVNSSALRSIVRKKLKASGSILVIISQTRQNVGYGFAEKTRSGGDALFFYAHSCVWTKIVKKLQKPVGTKKHDVGDTVRFTIKKNRVSGRHARVDVDFLFDYGFNDVGSMIRFLIEEGVFKKRNGMIDAKGLDIVAKESKLGREIQDAGKVPALKKLTRIKWKEIEKQLKTELKPRYS